MRFPEDFHVERVRDLRVPSETAIRKTMAQRVAWLEVKIAEREAAGLGAGFFVDELAAIATLMHADPEWPARVQRQRDHMRETNALIAEDAS